MMASSRLVLCWLVAGCGVIEVKPAGTSNDPYTPSEGSGDDDVDEDCDVTYDVAALGGPDCVTEALSCGDSVETMTGGGSQYIDGPALQSWFCTIAGDSDYLGPERVYEFVHPGDSSEVTISMQEPCGGLELFVMGWADDECPVEGTGVLQCDEALGTGQLKIWDNEPRRYIIIVDGADTSLPFSLSVFCP
jgi:hypothetical protein